MAKLRSALLATTLLAHALAVGLVSGSLRQRVDNPRLPDISDAVATRVKRVPRFLSEADIASLHAVANVARTTASGYTPQATLDRQLREGGRTVWINHFLREELPELHGRILQAAKEADEELWGGVLNDRAMLSIRSAEYHTVMHEGGVAMAPHADHGSLITIDLMLSDTSEFEGGQFQTLETDGQL